MLTMFCVCVCVCTSNQPDTFLFLTYLYTIDRFVKSYKKFGGPLER